MNISLHFYYQLCDTCGVQFDINSKSCVYLLTTFIKTASQGTPQMAVDKEAISLSRVYAYCSKRNLHLLYV